MSIESQFSAFDELFEANYDVFRHPEGEEVEVYFEDDLKARPELVELREHIRDKLMNADYFNWRGGDEISSFIEGFTAASILLSQSVTVEASSPDSV